LLITLDPAEVSFRPLVTAGPPVLKPAWCAQHGQNQMKELDGVDDDRQVEPAARGKKFCTCSEEAE
jgi:hypothetical protein